MQAKSVFLLSRLKFSRGIVVMLGALIIALAGAWYLEGTVPRRAVIASGTESGVNHLHAQRYAQILAQDGIALEEKLTAGAAENLRLLLDRNSGVDLAIIPGGIATTQEGAPIMMLAALQYEPLWVFYRGEATLTQLSDLRHKRISVGSQDSSVRAFVAPLLDANDVSDANATIDPRTHQDAVTALRNDEVDAILLLGSVKAPAIWAALNEPTFKLMSLEGAEAYQRHFPHITKLTLPPGAINLARKIPAREIHLIGTKSMLVAREGLAFPLIQLLLDAARQIHSTQGYFEAPAEFPNTMPVDLPVSLDATRHLRFGPKMLQRYMPLVAASYVERVFVLLVPLVVIMIPLLEFAWRLFRVIVMRRIHQLYGELTLLEREIDAATDGAAASRWLEELGRIERDTGKIKIPDGFANKVYILREHIKLVRQEVLSKAEARFQQVATDYGNPH